ncbi:MAG: hypothetical protein JRJ39_16325 [Deltaproteobacteria bacterium]|nr:hypothetical protein [Deltaproteobacteria bacterium]
MSTPPDKSKQPLTYGVLGMAEVLNQIQDMLVMKFGDGSEDGPLICITPHGL